MQPIILNVILGRVATKSDGSLSLNFNLNQTGVGFKIPACNDNPILLPPVNPSNRVTSLLRASLHDGRELFKGATMKSPIGSNRLAITCPHCGKSITRFIPTHGRYNTPEYRSWWAMKARCLNPKNISFPNYGGRGISICDQWMTFENFFKDMGKKPTPAHSLERINRDGNYELSNCKWAGRQEQNRNRGVTKFFTRNGETKTLTEWATHIGMSQSGLSRRINDLHWDVQQAISTPPKRKRHASAN